MPDQSLSNEPVSGKTDQEAGNPADVAGNDPSQASPESLESNVSRASEGEQQQADVTINQDPVVSTGDVQTAGSEDYDDENAWPYRKLQQRAKQRGLDGSGKREEIVARLRDTGGVEGEDETPRHLQGVETTDATDEGIAETPRESVDSDTVDNGGIQRTGRGQEHAEILQGLSAERRQQQQQQQQSASDRSGRGEE